MAMKTIPLATASVLLLRACGGDLAPSAAGVVSYNGLVAALRAQGERVERGERVEQPFLAVPGRFLRVSGEDVQVFEYRDAAAAQADATRVSPDGGTIGTSKPFWAAPPHFYRAGRVIALSMGESVSLRAVLQRVLGRPFAGP